MPETPAAVPPGEPSNSFPGPVSHTPPRPPSTGLFGVVGSAGPEAGLIAAALLLVAAADVLFWNHGVGWTLGGYSVGLLTVVAAVNRDLLAERWGKLAFAAAAAASVALVDAPSALGVGLFLIGVATLLCAGVADAFRNPAAWLEGLVISGIQSVVRAQGDVRAILQHIGGGGLLAGLAGIARAWALPLLGAGVFLFLFAIANPLIDQLVQNLDPGRWAYVLPDDRRVAFWCVCGAFVWLLLRTRLRGFDGQLGRMHRLFFPAIPVPSDAQSSSLRSWLFSEPAIVRSMLVFNVMFALQNGLDASYLWGDRALPAGFTFAAYAHRGAYPLMVTAILAAAFVMIAFRAGSPSEVNPTARRLMYLWIAQNVVLVISACWRMMLYVEAYSLTQARVAVLAWMGLVAIGLVLLVLRFVRGKSNDWLVGMNLASLAAVLYVAAFADIEGYIADYNVAHSREAGGKGPLLDLGYLRTLGPSATPAVRRFIAVTASGADGGPVIAGYSRHAEAILLEAELMRQHLKWQSDWRTWTLRSYRNVPSAVRAEAASSTRP